MIYINVIDKFVVYKPFCYYCMKMQFVLKERKCHLNPHLILNT